METHTIGKLTYQERLDVLRAEKLRQTQEKQAVIGSMDHDDWALILPPPDRRKIVQAMSTSGMPITDCLLEGYEPESNHESRGFFGPKTVGNNYRALLESHPVYIDPLSSLAGGYMVNFSSYREPGWNPDLATCVLRPDLAELHQKYQLHPGIGATQHFCQDLQIGLDLGWRGILEKIHYFRAFNLETIPAPEDTRFAPVTRQEMTDFYDGLEAITLGIRTWIQHHADAARAMAENEDDPQLRQNLLEIAEVNDWIVAEPPRTLREVCQWILWFQMAARMYNGSGSLGRLDVLLTPYYEREVAAGTLTDEEAIFHIACLLLRDTAYLQVGGPDAEGRDVTNAVSYLILEAAHRLKIPANVGVAVGCNVDPGLLRRGVEIMFEDKKGVPKFLGVERTAEGFARNGYDIGWGYERAYSGCHWNAIPGREYTLNDCVKINFAAIFEVAWKEMTTDLASTPPLAREGGQSVARLWDLYVQHLRKGVRAIADSLDFHTEYMYKVFPELVIDLLCHGPIERGLDASHGGVEFYNLCLDGAALATVADSFAALEQRIEQEGKLTWDKLAHYIATDWAGPEGERARLMMRSIPRYGTGGANADAWATRIAQVFTGIVKETPTPGGFTMLPGLFSWANTIPMGQGVGATPNGRHAGAPIAHGSNPDPGFRKDGAPTAMAVAIASVQPGYGNTAPMQMELDPALSKDEGGVDHVADLIKTHFDLGGTQINLNIMDAEKVLEAHKDPSKYPDLVVRVTGFSAYFASLSPEFRQLVVNRIITEG
ncbi:MAG: formate acetyltransferase [Anaerolineae bacterium]|nr:formate acetyltransferase [Anaerolineae bacterium]